jgi:enoyl-CoA hydratase
MPETGIGLFPDVGGGWFLPRLPGRIGTYMALTGARLRGGDCMVAGIGTHYASEARLHAMKEQIERAARSADPVAALRSGLDTLSQDPSETSIQQAPTLTSAALDKFDAWFAGDRVEQIISTLQDSRDETAATLLKIMAQKSPLSQKVALRQLRLGAKLTSFRDVMRMEQAIARRLVRAHDFREGVRAQIIDKDNAPRWSPATLADVTDEMVDAVFSPLDAGEALRFVD